MNVMFGRFRTTYDVLLQRKDESVKKILESGTCVRTSDFESQTYSNLLICYYKDCMNTTQADAVGFDSFTTWVMLISS